VSFAIDANVLLYASDVDNPHHPRAAQLLQEWVRAREILYLPWPAIMAYLRIATHTNVFASPLTPSEAQGNIDSLLMVPHVGVLAEGPKFWQCYLETAKGLIVRGNLVPDAHIAALMLEHGVREIVTNDSDFLKFTSLRVVNPFQ
jgi:toxin-antitoxin system PIN domain toxin